MWKYFLAWIPMLLMAIANGALRDLWYSRCLPELRAHQLSTLILILLLAAYLWVIIRLWRPASSAQALILGGMWVGLTVAFEFLFGHYVAGHTWNWLLQDYNLLAGRVWVLVLVWLLVAPYLFWQWQR